MTTQPAEYYLVITYRGGWKELITGYTSHQQAEMHAVRAMAKLPEITGYEVGSQGDGQQPAQPGAVGC